MPAISPKIKLVTLPLTCDEYYLDAWYHLKLFYLVVLQSVIVADGVDKNWVIGFCLAGYFLVMIFIQLLDHVLRS